MSPTSTSVRVFISSTFRDMHAERDHLVTVVFPELRERIEQLGLEFFDVDLRWGVPAKDLNGETANSWEYCRQWIDRVEPFFVCLLGQRYGWVPEPQHFRDDADRQRQQREPRSITDLEVRHAVLDQRRKRRSYFYLREMPVPEPKSGASREELDACAEFVAPEPEAGKLRTLKQEVKKSGRPVRNYPAEWTGHGFAGLKEFGDVVLEDLWSGVLRDERYVPKAIWRQVLNTDPDGDPRYINESQPVPRELWEKLVALAKPPPPDPLDAERQQMETFAASRLRWFQGRTPELQQLTGFIQSTDANAPRLAVVAAAPGQGKSALIARLWESIRRPAFTRCRPAEAGIPSGKPLTRPADPLTPSREERVGGPFVIAHFVGATERSASSHALVQRLLDELDRSDIAWPAEEAKEREEPKRDFNSLCNRLRQRLGEYAGNRRIMILLDGLNQLTDGHGLVWLPHRLGPGVRMVVSCVKDAELDVPASAGSDRVNAELQTPERRRSRGDEARTSIPRQGASLPPSAAAPEEQVLGALERWKDASLRVPLGPLTEDEVRTIVVEYLKEYCKELEREHVEAICRVEQARNPLYLLVLLGELRTLGGNDMNRIVGERITALPRDYPDTVALFCWVLERLEVFGAEPVRLWCTYLALGRVGMSSRELAGLLVRKLDVNAASTALRIERGLRRHLLHRGPHWDFLHGRLRAAVTHRYLRDDRLRVEAHKEIAAYFEERRGRRGAGSRGVGVLPPRPGPTTMLRITGELPFHCGAAGDMDGLQRVLCDLDLLDWALGVSCRYDWISYWRSLEGTVDPAAAYAAAIDHMRHKEGDSARLVAMMSKVASLLRDLGQPSPACDFAERAFAISKRVNGDAHPATGHLLGQLANAALDLGRYHEAKAHLEQLIEMDGKLPMTHAAQKAAHLSAYGVVLQRLDQHDPAREAFSRAARIYQAGARDDPHGMASHLMNFASAHHKMGRVDEAERTYAQALSLMENAMPGSPLHASCLSMLAEIHVSEACSLALTGS